jgi:hypothetical protein
MYMQVKYTGACTIKPFRAVTLSKAQKTMEHITLSCTFLAKGGTLMLQKEVRPIALYVYARVDVSEYKHSSLLCHCMIWRVSTHTYTHKLIVA